MKAEIPVQRAYRLLNPGEVVLVTSGYRDRVNIMTAAWQVPISLNPPLVGLCIAFPRFTCELINESEEFGINIPGAEMLSEVELCGKISGRECDKFREAGLTAAGARKIRAPLIEECLGHIECGVVNRYKAGDHFLFVGEVLAASAREDCFQEHWKEEVELLHHLGGRLYYLGGGVRKKL